MVSYILLFLLVLAAQDILREGFVFTRYFIETRKYEISPLRLGGLWASVAYVITVAILGI